MKIIDEQAKRIPGVWIPMQVFFNKSLTGVDIFVWCMIDLLDTTEDNCFASNEYIAKKLGLKSHTVSNSISKLKKLGYIKQISFDGRIRRLAIDHGYIEKYRHIVDEFNS